VFRPVTAFDDTELGSELDDEVQEALGDAMEVLDDQFVEEIASRFADPEGHADWLPFSDLHLPRRYRDEYGVLFVRRIHISFLSMTVHLASAPWAGLACRAEEFALNALITQVRVDIETQGLPSAAQARINEALLILTDAAFDDTDFAFAFDLAADGIDDPDTVEGQAMGIGPLHPRHWFEPFNERVPHPLVQTRFSYEQ
jgi:hypothetical protein